MGRTNGNRSGMFAHVPYSTPIHICQIFRHEDGEPNLDPEAGLHLQLQDFAAEALVEGYEDLHDPIFIPSTALCAYLGEGEDIASTVNQWKGTVTHRKPGLIMRHRESTPPEEIQPDREAIC
jgi:hypothetical protein